MNSHRTMMRFLPFALAAGLCAGITAQNIPGVKATLAASRSVVSANSTVDLRLSLEVAEDASLPSALLSGTALEIEVDGKPAGKISAKGKGGKVAVAAGTTITRSLKIPASRFVEGADTGSMAAVSVRWVGLAGANCVFRVAPDSSKIDLGTLDLSKTKVLLITNHGEMTLGFRPDKAPNHVKNFLKLAQQGFYDGTKFHRVIRGFMIQGGDPNSKDDDKQAMWGQGGPGYKIDAEFNDLHHVRGTLSMARSQDPNSAGSQFFIVHKDAPHLDGKYTAFGYLESGADCLDSIANTPTGRNDRPVDPVILEAVVILPAKK